MTKRDDGKVSWVEFLRSINFASQGGASARKECTSHFADFNPRARKGEQSDTEDSFLVRSGN